VLAVVPAFNEQESIGSTIEELTSVNPGIDVLVVDDGSGDHTARVARRAGAIVCQLPYNLGVGGAMRAGYRYALRHDGYSRAVAGMSSGGAGAFSAAWFAPREFARVQSALGSFTPMQPVPTDGIRGANVYADWVRRERRPIRVWLSDGARDVYLGGAHGVRPELAAAGSWPEANHRLAAALRDGGYDICFRFGTAGHNTAQEALDLPESLTWLWRGYDPARVDDAVLPG